MTTTTPEDNDDGDDDGTSETDGALDNVGMMGIDATDRAWTAVIDDDDDDGRRRRDNERDSPTAARL